MQARHILTAKKAIRQSIKAALKQLSPAVMAEESTAICRAILSHRFFHQAQTVGLYVHCAKLMEVDTSELLQTAMKEGKKAYVPVVKDKARNMQLLHLDRMDCLVSVPPFGILEPKPTYDDGTHREDALTAHAVLDLLLMPGLGFDYEGHRLGRGGGYYDKAVANLIQYAADKNRAPPLLVALAYSVQVVPAVPVDEHDQNVDILATTSGLRGCTERGKAVLNSD